MEMQTKKYADKNNTIEIRFIIRKTSLKIIKVKHKINQLSAFVIPV